MCHNHHIIFCGDLFFYSDAFVSHMVPKVDLNAFSCHLKKNKCLTNEFVGDFFSQLVIDVLTLFLVRWKEQLYLPLNLAISDESNSPIFRGFGGLLLFFFPAQYKFL